MTYNDHALDTFHQKYAKDLILCCLGDEASLYARDFKFTKLHLQKYQNNIVKNKSLLTGKKILDIGSSAGMWAVLMYLNGATKVTCIEPRKQLATGINQFAKLHNLPINAINSFHSSVFDLNEVFDTTFMLGVDDRIPDVVTFINDLRKISNFLVLRTQIYDGIVPDNAVEINIDHNLYWRGGFNINTDINDLDGLCYQTNANDWIDNPKQGRSLKWHFGKNFYEILFDYLDYKIINFSTYSEGLTLHYKMYCVDLKCVS